MENSADLESQLVESLNSVSTIKSFGLEDFTNLKTENRFFALLRSVYKSGINGILGRKFSGVCISFVYYSPVVGRRRICP